MFGVHGSYVNVCTSKTFRNKLQEKQGCPTFNFFRKSRLPEIYTQTLSRIRKLSKNQNIQEHQVVQNAKPSGNKR